VNGTSCVKCPYQCQTCTSPNGACITCVDTIRRDRTQNCRCLTGFFDSGALNCSACSPTCLTCTNASACTSCDATRFRNLTSGTLCSCIDGYYELFGADQSRTCVKCNPECLTCTSSPANCVRCDPREIEFQELDPMEFLLVFVNLDTTQQLMDLVFNPTVMLILSAQLVNKVSNSVFNVKLH